jgi:hypothetical protein
MCKGNREEGVALPAVLHCPHHNQCASCRPSFASGPCSLAGLPVRGVAAPDIDSSGPTVFLYFVPTHLLTDSVIGQPRIGSDVVMRTGSSTYGNYLFPL